MVKNLAHPIQGSAICHKVWSAFGSDKDSCFQYQRDNNEKLFILPMGQNWATPKYGSAFCPKVVSARCSDKDSSLGIKIERIFYFSLFWKALYSPSDKTS